MIKKILSKTDTKPIVGPTNADEYIVPLLIQKPVEPTHSVHKAPNTKNIPGDVETDQVEVDKVDMQLY